MNICEFLIRIRLLIKRKRKPPIEWTPKELKIFDEIVKVFEATEHNTTIWRPTPYFIHHQMENKIMIHPNEEPTSPARSAGAT